MELGIIVNPIQKDKKYFLTPLKSAYNNGFWSQID